MLLKWQAQATVCWPGHMPTVPACCPNVMLPWVGRDPKQVPGLLAVVGCTLLSLCHHFGSSLLQIEHCHAECVTDTQVCGARFCDPEGNSFAVTGYDLSEIFRYGQA